MTKMGLITKGVYYTIYQNQGGYTISSLNFEAKHLWPNKCQDRQPWQSGPKQTFFCFEWRLLNVPTQRIELSPPCEIHIKSPNLNE
jgi:hypothetical protein